MIQREQHREPRIGGETAIREGSPRRESELNRKSARGERERDWKRRGQSAALPGIADLTMARCEDDISNLYLKYPILKYLFYSKMSPVTDIVLL